MTPPRNVERSAADPAMPFVHDTFGDADVCADQVVTVFAAELDRHPAAT